MKQPAPNKSPSKLGRRSLLTPKLQKRICDLLRKGHTIASTCGATGISERSYHDWCEKNPAFSAATQRARSEGKIRIVDSILDSNDWRAKAWYLERCYPTEFARISERQLLYPEPQPVLEPMTPEQEKIVFQSLHAFNH
jgi:hypothetical protein